MIWSPRWNHPITIHLVSAIHFLQGATLVLAPIAANATPLRLIVIWCGTPLVAGALLIAAAVMASWLFVGRSKSWVWALPQQSLLMLASAGAVKAIWLGRYADGTVIASAHIFADQLLLLVLTVAHFASMYQWVIQCVVGPLKEDPCR